MTCIKTGCNVYYENYGYSVRADLYRVGQSYVVRFNQESRSWAPDAKQIADYMVQHWSADEVWHREDLGVTVVPLEYFWEVLT